MVGNSRNGGSLAASARARTPHHQTGMLDRVAAIILGERGGHRHMPVGCVIDILYNRLLLLLLSPTAGGQADVPAGEGSCIPRGRGAFGGRSRPSPWQGVIGAFSSSPFSPRHHGSASLCETLGRTKKWSRDRDQGPLVLQLPTYTQLLHDLEACRAVSP